MTDYEEVVDMAVDSLLGLFGENAPENAASDVAIGFSDYGPARDCNLEAFAEDIWERYHVRIKHKEA